MQAGRPIRVAIIGFGKIARDQHLPAIAVNPDFQLVAAVSPRGQSEAGLAMFRSHVEMLAALPDLDAVAISTPPALRYAIARDCALAGLDMLLEKPPTATLGEIAELERLSSAHSISLFTAWHARFNPAVDAAADALAGHKIAAMEIVWSEDVRKWHPGQSWIWSPGGFGVFDPGINALSIATAIIPAPLLLSDAILSVPSNRQAPIAARLTLTSPAAVAPLTARFEWRAIEGETWTIEVRTVGGTIVKLAEGGAKLEIDGVAWAGEGEGEYPAIYRRFATLVRERRSEVDVEPLRIVADAFLVGRRETTEPFLD